MDHTAAFDGDGRRDRGRPFIQKPCCGAVGFGNGEHRRHPLVIDFHGILIAFGEGVTRRRIKERRRHTRNPPELPVFHGLRGKGAQQPPCVRVARVVKDFLGGPDLDDFPGIHHGDPVRDAGDHAQIVRNQHDADAGLALDITQQVEHLRLYGHIQRRSGFVGEEDVRVQGQRDGKHAPLAHPSGKIVRLQNALEPVNDNELVIKYKIVRHRIFLGAESFFFEEGQDTLYQKAVYGGLKVDGKGQSLLVGLYDENFHYIQSDK